MNKGKHLNKFIIILVIFAILISPFSVFSIENEEYIEKNNTIEDEDIKEIQDDIEEKDEIIESEEENKVIESEEKDDILSATKNTSVSYTTHVQYVGWQKYVSNGKMAGTSGKALRLEGIKIKLEDQKYTGDIEYRTHVQNIGWQSYVKNDVLSGTSGKSLRLEAIEIRLTGEMANHYDVYYRVHAENFGWLGWAKNGESAGTAGFSYRLEGIEIKLIDKGSQYSDYGKSKAFQKKSVLYTTHVQDYGWQNYAYDGNMSGTSGKAKRLEGIKIKLSNQDYAGDIEYRTYIQNIGWQNYVKNDALSGTSGKSLRLEAIKIKLTGEMANHYDVYYRVHAENFGWLGWAKNDEISGTIGYAFRLEGIEIKLVEKGQSAPGSTNKINAIRYVKYQAYQSSWQSFKYDSDQAGTIGKQLEAIKVNLISSEYSGNVVYSSYITGSGWQNTVSNGTTTNSNNKKLEAIKINLTGDIAKYYDIYYSVYISSTGWTGWAKNDAPCGNIGNGKRIEAYKVKMVTKNSSAPGSTNNSYTEDSLRVNYSSYVPGVKWQSYVSDGKTSGTTGKGKVIQGIKIDVNKKIPKGSISYSTHVSYVGWQNYVSDDTQAGKIGNNIEAIKIKLTGELANSYDVYYRVHVSNVGWMGWTSNDQPAGTQDAALGVEAIEIKLVQKGGQAPQNTSDTATTSAYLKAHWETDADGNRYFYNIFGNMVKGGSYQMGVETYYFGPSGIFLGTKNLEILDISAHNGVVDWKAVSESNVYGVILRIAASAEYRDSKLKENVEGCKKYGIPYGIYIYSYAESYTEGVAYGNFTKELIDEFNMNPTLGIFLDLESNNITQFMGTTEYTAVVKGYYSVIPNAEVYTYLNYADTALNTSYIRNKITWIAHYYKECRYTGSYRMWQYTSTGRNAGVSGNVDRSILYSFR